jgi:hypothetical protein
MQSVPSKGDTIPSHSTTLLRSPPLQPPSPNAFSTSSSASPSISTRPDIERHVRIDVGGGDTQTSGSIIFKTKKSRPLSLNEPVGFSTLKSSAHASSTLTLTAPAPAPSSSSSSSSSVPPQTSSSLLSNILRKSAKYEDEVVKKIDTPSNKDCDPDQEGSDKRKCSDSSLKRVFTWQLEVPVESQVEESEQNSIQTRTRRVATIFSDNSAVTSPQQEKTDKESRRARSSSSSS